VKRTVFFLYKEETAAVFVWIEPYFSCTKRILLLFLCEETRFFPVQRGDCYCFVERTVFFLCREDNAAVFVWSEQFFPVRRGY
jgi:hypothetical protein